MWLWPRFRFANHLLLIACSYPRGSGLVGRSKQSRPIYLSMQVTDSFILEDMRHLRIFVRVLVWACVV